jgi:hypothetical protein
MTSEPTRRRRRGVTLRLTSFTPLCVVVLLMGIIGVLSEATTTRPTTIQHDDDDYIDSSIVLFPSVYFAQIDRKDLLTPLYQERLAEMDLLHVDCPPTGTSASAFASTSSTSASSSTITITSSCRIQALVHSAEELDYFQQQEQWTTSPLKFDADATEAVVLAPQRNRQLQEDSNSTMELLGGYSRISEWPCYLDYGGMMDWIQDLVDKNHQGDYPHLNMTWMDIGDSYLKTITTNSSSSGGGGGGHDIHALKLSSATSTAVTTAHRAPMLILTGVHPREYSPPEMVRQWIYSFLDASNVEQQVILESTDIYWIPYVNPDGRVLAETTTIFRRKNLNNQAEGSDGCRQEDVGVDINRNFPFRWGRDDGSSDLPCLQTFRGSGPASEPETQAVVQLAKAIFGREQQRFAANSFLLENDNNPTTVVGYNESITSGIFLDIHSFGNYYIYVSVLNVVDFLFVWE